MSNSWYEIWADEGQAVPYVVILRPSTNGFEVLDPVEQNSRIHEASTYDDARMWLLEDEFVLVGRKEIDEP